MSSITIDQLESAVYTKVNALGLTDPTGKTMSVVQRKEAKRQLVDPNYLVLVTHKPEGEKRKRFASSFDSTTHNMQVTFIAPNNDNQSANIANYASWRDATLELFKQRPSDSFGLNTNVAGIRDVSAKAGPWLPPGSIEKNYDYQFVDVFIEVISVR